jgi:hypothetical protein
VILSWNVDEHSLDAEPTCSLICHLFNDGWPGAEACFGVIKQLTCLSIKRVPVASSYMAGCFQWPDTDQVMLHVSMTKVFVKTVGIQRRWGLRHGISQPALLPYLLDWGILLFVTVSSLPVGLFQMTVSWTSTSSDFWVFVCQIRVMKAEIVPCSGWLPSCLQPVCWVWNLITSAVTVGCAS